MLSISNSQKKTFRTLVQTKTLSSMLFNPFQPSVVFHIDTNHLFPSPKQMTGFYMERNTGLMKRNNGLKLLRMNIYLGGL